ncbi:NB-ARC domain protein [Parafrankia sp. EUN1f]|nr:NB-ARC domain protein [Parafrankia sp. EUN1f]
MGGAGKSTLAVALIHDPVVCSLFPDGIVWERIGSEPDIAGILRHLLNAFGDSSHVSDVDVGVRRLRSLLSGAQCLIVLDDVWDIAIVEALRLPSSVRVLVTSRTRAAWYADAAAYELAMLDEHTARRMLAKYAGLTVDELPAVADEIVERCDGLALALALVGSMFRLGSRWQYIVERLRGATLHKLTARFPGYLYQNLFAALDVSVQALPPSESDRFRDLVVFAGRGPVPIDIVALLWGATGGLDSLDVEEMVNLLGLRSLVRVDRFTGTITLHDLLFDYMRVSIPEGRYEWLNRVLSEALLCRWGGVQSGFPGLRERVSIDLADRYGLAWLIPHLAASDIPNTIDQVLALEGSGDGVLINVWFDVHEQLGMINSYLSDVDTAWRLAKERTDRDLAEGRLATTLGMEIRYVAMKGSILLRVSRVPPKLMYRLVESGIWTLEYCLEHVGAIPEGRDRVSAVCEIIDLVPEASRDALIHETLDRLDDFIYSDSVRLASLARSMPLTLLRMVVDGAKVSTIERWSRNLILLKHHIDPVEFSEMLIEAFSRALTEKSSGALSVLIPHLDQSRLDRIIESLRSWSSDAGEVYRVHKVQALCEISRRLDGDQRSIFSRWALALASGIEGHPQRFEAFLAFDDEMIPDRRSRLVDIALSVEDPYHRLFSIRSVIECGEKVTPLLVDEMLRCTHSVDSDAMRAECLGAVSEFLSETARINAQLEALDLLARSDNLDDWFYTLDGISLELDHSLLRRAFLVCQRIDDAGDVAKTVSEYALILGEERQVVSSTEFKDMRSSAKSPEQRAALEVAILRIDNDLSVSSILDAVEPLHVAGWSAVEFDELLPFVTAGVDDGRIAARLEDIINTEQWPSSRLDLTVQLLKHNLPDPRLRRDIAVLAFRSVLDINNDDLVKAREFAELVQYVPADMGPEALATARELGGYVMPWTLAAIAMRGDWETDLGLADDPAAALAGETEGYVYARALLCLCRCADGESREVLVRAALHSMRKVSDTLQWAFFLAAVAPYVDSRRFRPFLDLIDILCPRDGWRMVPGIPESMLDGHHSRVAELICRSRPQGVIADRLSKTLMRLATAKSMIFWWRLVLEEGAKMGRSTFVQAILPAASVVAKYGGNEAVEEAALGILDCQRWWP